MMKQVLLNLCVSLVSIVIFIFVLEVCVRFYFSQHLNYDFEMWRYAVELKEPIADPQLPFHHKPDRIGNYYGVEIKTNSGGLRNVELMIPKPIGIKRVLMLGDSFTLGWGVPFENTFSKRLEEKLHAKLKGYEVVNMGTGNYNSSMEVELFKRKGLLLEPDVVVLMYYVNDTEPTPRIGSASYHLLKQFYLTAYVNSRLKQLEMMNNGDDWLQEYYRKLYLPDTEGFRKGKESINELIRITSEKRIKLLIVNIPDLRRLRGYPFGFAKDLPQRLAAEGSIPFLDLLPYLEKYDGETLWVSKEDAHMNSLANSIVAEAIFNKLDSEKMLK